MADKTIPDLTDGGAVQSGDQVHVYRDPNSRRATLGTAAGAASGDFATATQGGKADTAVQPGDLGNSASRDVGTTAGTVAAGDDARFGSVDLASTTEVLAGTDTAKAATPNAIAALWEKGSNVASASTISLGEGGFFHVTGTTTITDIDFATAKDGRHAILEFDGILTLTHNATTLKLPGGANIVTAAGDTCMVVQDSGDNVRVAWYQRASGLPVVAPPAGGIELLATLSSTSGASVSLTGITGSYRHLLVVLMDVSASGTGAFQIAVSSNNGSSYGADVTFTNSQSNAIRLYILGWVFQAGVSGSEKTIISSGVTGGQEASVTGVVNAIRVKPTGSLDFDAGSILVFKVP